MLDLKGLYSPFSALKFIHIVPTIQRDFALKKKNISHLFINHLKMHLV